MTQQLPTPGGDVGTWGTMLNGFLGVAHNTDGTLATSAVSAAGAEMTSNKGAANGYPGLNASSLVPLVNLGTGTASSSNFLRGDGTWAVPPTAGNATTGAPGLIQLAGDLGGISTSATAPTLAATTNVENIISANTTVAGALQQANNLSELSSTTNSGTARTNIKVPHLTPAAVVAVSSITGTYVQGTATFTPTSITPIDGYTYAGGDIILLTAQGNASNGVWLVPNTGSTWTRPTEFVTGSVVKGRSIVVINGTVNGNTIWVLDAPTAGVTIDTSSQTWVNPLTQTGFLQYITSHISPDELLPAQANTNLGNNRITNLAAPLSDTDAAQAIGSQIGYTSYLPSTTYLKTTNTTTGAAVDTTNLTVSFTAISTKVLVEIEGVLSFFSVPAVGQSIAFTLYTHSTTTQQGSWVEAFIASAASNSAGQRVRVYIEVDGLTAGTAYHWDLGWAASAGTALLNAQQTQSATYTASGQSGGIYMRVYAQ